MPYDTSEARYLIALASDAHNPDVDARGRASMQLFAAVQEAAKDLRFEAVLDGTRLWLTPEINSEKGRWVSIAQDGRPAVVGSPGDQSPATPISGIVFDPVTKKWEGVAFDEFRVPTPNEVRRRRSAVAVLVETVFGSSPVPSTPRR